MVFSKNFDMHHVMGSLRARGDPYFSHGRPQSGPHPFITISREAASGGHTLGRGLAERLNRLAHSQTDDPHILTPLWQCYDRELVERIAQDHHVSTHLIESLETGGHSWLEEFFQGLGHQDTVPDELALVRRAAQTVRALALGGYVILIGYGTVFITHDM